MKITLKHHGAAHHKNEKFHKNIFCKFVLMLLTVNVVGSLYKSFSNKYLSKDCPFYCRHRIAIIYRK